MKKLSIKKLVSKKLPVAKKVARFGKSKMNKLNEKSALLALLLYVAVTTPVRIPVPPYIPEITPAHVSQVILVLLEKIN